MGRPAESAGDQRGFTIVEMMITLLILGILVTMVVMTFAISRSRAQASACKANLRTIESALQEYRSMHEGLNPPVLWLLVDPNYPTYKAEGEPYEEPYLKDSFVWICPSGGNDYIDNYNSATGEVTCPHPGHSL